MPVVAVLHGGSCSLPPGSCSLPAAATAGLFSPLGLPFPYHGLVLPARCGFLWFTTTYYFLYSPMAYTAHGFIATVCILPVTFIHLLFLPFWFLNVPA